MAQILGIYGSPRKGGNSDILLDALLASARDAGAETTVLYSRKLKIHGCLECGGCDETGTCVIRDDMDQVYEAISRASAVVLSSPVFFYGFPSELKALVDRCQALWSGRLLRKQGAARKVYDSGTGWLLAVGASRGENLFSGCELAARYFCDALDREYRGGLFYRRVEKKGAISDHPTALSEARTLGGRIALELSQHLET